MTDTVPCPDCDHGWTHVVGVGDRRCMRCDGTNRISAEMADWIKRGEQMRQERVGRSVGLRDEAKRRGLSAKMLSDMESGRIEPKE